MESDLGAQCPQQGAKLYVASLQRSHTSEAQLNEEEDLIRRQV